VEAPAGPRQTPRPRATHRQPALRGGLRGRDGVDARQIARGQGRVRRGPSRDPRRTRRPGQPCRTLSGSVRGAGEVVGELIVARARGGGGWWRQVVRQHAVLQSQSRNSQRVARAPITAMRPFDHRCDSTIRTVRFRIFLRFAATSQAHLYPQTLPTHHHRSASMPQKSHIASDAPQWLLRSRNLARGSSGLVMFSKMAMGQAASG